MIITGLLIPMAGIILGSAIVFFTRHQMSELLQKTLFGFAAGVMMAAAVWSLLLPSIEMCDDLGKWATVPSALGFMLGIGFLLLIDIITPHLHFGTTKPEGPRSRLSRTTMLLLAVSIHHLPEGMAVGVVLAGAEHAETGITSMSALIVAAGIAIQNVPEGAIVSIPMRAAGKSRWKSFTFRLSQRCHTAYRSYNRNTFVNRFNTTITIHALLCSRSHALRCCRGTHSRSL